MSDYLFFIVTMTLVCTAIGQYSTNSKKEGTSSLGRNIPAVSADIPLDAPGRCPEPMLLYPKPDGTWMCACSPGLLYHSETKTCYTPFDQGPCEPGSYINLPKGKDEPVCTKNPCPQKDLIPFNGKCYAIGNLENSPCSDGSAIFVDTTTFQLECRPAYATSVINAPKFDKNPCPSDEEFIAGACRERA